MDKKSVASLIMAILLSSILSWLPGSAEAKEKQHTVVVAALVYGQHNIVTLDGFKAGLREKGFVEGDNITYIFEGAVGSKEKLGAMMEQLMAKNPDLIFAATTPGAIAAQKATAKRKIPVVFGPVNDPMVSGIVKDQKMPGDNITGVMLTDSTGKQLEWAVRISPTLKTILFPYNPNDKSSLISFQKIKEATATLNIEMVARQTRSHAEIDALIADCPEGVDALFLPRDAMVMSRVKDFAELALQRKIILSGNRLEMVKKGSLFSFGFEGYELGKQMARLADLILHGKNPGELPVETAEDYLAINLKTAKAMGMTISENILRQAHTIIRPE